MAHSPDSAPRAGSLILPSLSIPQSNFRQMEPPHEPFDSKPPKEGLSFDNVPITPAQEFPSHFSPTTPALERGFSHLQRKDGYQGKPGFLRDRISLALNGESSNQCPCGHKKRGLTGWLLLALLAFVIVFLFANVIVLDIDMGRTASTRSVQQLSDIVATMPSVRSTISRPSTSSSAAPVPSASTTPVDLTTAKMPQDAQTCVSQFPVPAGSDSKSWCARCVPAIVGIPVNWFTAQAHDPVNGPANLRTVANAAQYCSSLDAGGTSKALASARSKRRVTS